MFLGASPAVNVENGMKCETFFNEIMKTTVYNLPVNESINAEGDCCSDDLYVNFDTMNHEDLDYMLPFPLSFDKTAATCMAAP